MLGTFEDGSYILDSPFWNADTEIMDKEKSPSWEPKKL
jgi:hypothetical protein